MTLFVDTSAFYAVVDDGDVNNHRARKILGAGEPLVTSDMILAESWSLIHHRFGPWIAERFWAGIRAGGAVIEHIGPADLEVAWRIGEGFGDQDFSLVDRTSFAVMQRLGVHRAASFDTDFAIFRFGPRRERAFEVIA